MSEKTMTEKLISLDKKYTTRNGYPVTLYTLDHSNKDFPVVGRIGGSMDVCLWTKEGLFNGLAADDRDLIEVKNSFTFYQRVSLIYLGGLFKGALKVHLSQDDFNEIERKFGKEFQAKLTLEEK